MTRYNFFGTIMNFSYDDIFSIEVVIDPFDIHAIVFN